MSDNKVKNLVLSPPPRVTFGFVQLPSDLLLETEAASVLSQIKDVTWRVQKMRFKGAEEESPGKIFEDLELITEPVYRANYQSGCIRESVQCFFPRFGYGAVDYVALACTSMAACIGVKKIHAELAAGIAELRMGGPKGAESLSDAVPVLTRDMATAVHAALREVRLRKSFLHPQQDSLIEQEPLRVALVTPYVQETHDEVKRF
eukprot:TRINITY_DN49610_c0_g1_i1.p1 TRINITY_DN49610_c0_g1~~TRINITY_DN49610_c0_g1_i1.p1  ORF type:complete len:211 (-),score=10.90 TRINITY_DN49610_c0_g1_i1:826-1437(-)